MVWKGREHLFFQTSRENGKGRSFELQYLTIKRESVPKVVIEQSHPFELLGQCQGKVYIKDKRSGASLYRFLKDGKIAKKKNTKAWTKQLVSLRANGANTVMLFKDQPQKLFTLNQGCRSFGKDFWVGLKLCEGEER